MLTEQMKDKTMEESTGSKGDLTWIEKMVDRLDLHMIKPNEDSFIDSEADQFLSVKQSHAKSEIQEEEKVPIGSDHAGGSLH